MNDKAMTTTRDDFTGIQTRAGGAELAASTQEAAAVAAIQARFVLARRMPRVFDDVRTALLRECKRPRFSEVSRYSLPPRGREDKRIEGWSIRFVEAAIRIMGNIDAKTEVTVDDDERQVVRCSVLDLETNAGYSQELSVPKVVERKSLRANQVALSVRVGADGKPLYLIASSIDDVRTQVANQVSKVLRTLGLRLIPGDLLDECLEQVEETYKAEDKADPDAARKRLVDGFAGVGVRAVDLVEYLGGRPLDALTPADMKDLRGIFAALRTSEVRWAEVLDASPHRGTPTAEVDEKAAALRAKVAARTAGKGGGKAAPGGDATAKPAPSGGEAAGAPATTDGAPMADGSVPADQEPREPGSDG